MEIEADNNLEQPGEPNNTSAEVLIDENAPISTKLHLRGVDDLSTPEIKSYLDLHIKPGYCYDKRDEYMHLQYYLEWINDSELNVCFNSKDAESEESAIRGASEALNSLVARTPNETVDVIAEPLKERKAWDLIRLLNGKAKGKRVIKTDIAKQYAQATGLQINFEPEETENVCSDPISIFIRYATGKDHKVGNAREQSRYYLLHGEPEQFERRSAPRTHRRSDRPSFYEDGQPDLITGEVSIASKNYRNGDYRSRYDPQYTEDRGLKINKDRAEANRGRRQVRRSPKGFRSKQRREKAPARDLEDDLFPELLAKKKADRERDLSPSRMEQ